MSGCFTRHREMLLIRCLQQGGTARCKLCTQVCCELRGSRAFSPHSWLYPLLCSFLILQEKKNTTQALIEKGRRIGKSQHVCTCFKFLFLLKCSGSVSHSSSLWNSTEMSCILETLNFQQPTAQDKHGPSREQLGWAEDGCCFTSPEMSAHSKGVLQSEPFGIFWFQQAASLLLSQAWC